MPNPGTPPSPVAIGQTKLKAIRVQLRNRPGELAHAARLLANANVNIEGVECEILGTSAFARIYTTDIDRAEQALRQAGYVLLTTEILEVVLDNKPGELARACEALSSAGVNMESCFGSAKHTDHQIRLFMRVESPERAAKVLQSHQFRVHRWMH